MTTTELIEILKKVEKGASGRSREISFYVNDLTKDEVHFMPEPKISLNSTGDGCLGAEVTLMLEGKLK